MIVPHSLQIDCKLHISGLQNAYFEIVLAVVSKRIWRGKKKPELGWSYFSALHSVDASCKFWLKILLFDNLKHSFYFSATLFKNLIFEKHFVLLFCMEKILHFTLSAKFSIFYGNLVSRFQVKHFFMCWFVFVVEGNFLIGCIYQSHLQNTHWSICILIVTPKSAILEMSGFGRMCRSWQCPPNFFYFNRTQIKSLYRFRP